MSASNFVGQAVQPAADCPVRRAGAKLRRAFEFVRHVVEALDGIEFGLVVLVIMAIAAVREHLFRGAGGAL